MGESRNDDRRGGRIAALEVMLLGAVWAALAWPWPVAAQADTDAEVDELTQLKGAYEAKLAELEAPLETLKAQYAKGLEQLSTRLQQEGRLEAVLEVNAEIERLKAGGEPVETGLEELKSLRGIYEAERAKRKEAVSATVDALALAYVQALANLKAELTRESKIDLAQAAQTEETRVRADLKKQEQQEKPAGTNPLLKDLAVDDGHYYLKSQSKLSWPDAKKACEALGGYLVCINSSGENRFITELLAGGDSWTGGYLAPTSGDWQWLDGTRVSYRRWKDGEPNGRGPDGEPNIVIRPDGQWNDASAHRLHAYICEWDTRPEGAPEGIR